MPTCYRYVSFEMLLRHQAAYEAIDEAGSKEIPNWGIIEFEKGLIGCYGLHCTKEQEAMLRDSVNVLDTRMPFLKFQESGQHYAYELFLSDPNHWDSRGAPFFWNMAARAFTFDRLPMSTNRLEDKYLAIADSYGIPHHGDNYACVERFAAGGMSSGVVRGSFVEESLGTLKKRLSLYC